MCSQLFSILSPVANKTERVSGSVSPSLRVIFMGTSHFALPVLAAVLARYNVVCVYTQPPRLAGRGSKENKSPVHVAAIAAGLFVRTPQTLQDVAVWSEWDDLRADVGVVVAYGLILPEIMLKSIRFGCINVHASLLPRWRGAAPIQRAIMAGDLESGVSIMQMDSGMDTGPVFLRSSVVLTSDMTAGVLHDILAHKGADLLIQTLDSLTCGALVPEPQIDSHTTYAAKIIEDKECHISWTLPARVLSALVRALSPKPGAFCYHGRTRLKVLMATVVTGNGVPGTVLNDNLTVACGTDALQIIQVQRPGKATMSTATFLHGYPSLRKGVLLN